MPISSRPLPLLSLRLPPSFPLSFLPSLQTYDQVMDIIDECYFNPAGQKCSTMATWFYE